MNSKSNLSLHQIIKIFEKRNCIISIKNNLKHKMLFEFQPITKDKVKEIILSLDHNKAFGHDMISAKFLKLSADIIAGPLANIFNKGILQGTFPTSMKLAVVSPVYKNKVPFNKENYRPINVLTALSISLKKQLSFNYLHSSTETFLISYVPMENIFLPSMP